MADTPTSAYTYVSVRIRWSDDPVTLSSYIGHPDLGKVFFVLRSPQTLQIRLFKPEAAKRARHLIPCLKTFEGRTALGELRDDIGGKKLKRFDTLSTAAVEDAGDGRRWRRMRLTLHLKIRRQEYKDARNDKTAYTFINVHPAAALDQNEFDTEDESNDSQPENKTFETIEYLPPHPAVERNIPRRQRPETATGSATATASALSPGISAGIGAGIGATGVAALPTETPTSDDDDYESVPHTDEALDPASAPASSTQPLQTDDAAAANDHDEDAGVQADQIPSEHNTPAPSDNDDDEDDEDAREAGGEREASVHGDAEDELDTQARDLLARADDEIPDTASLTDQMDMEGGREDELEAQAREFLASAADEVPDAASVADHMDTEGGREDADTDDETENVSLERKRKRRSVGDESSQREEEEEEEEEKSPTKKSKSSEEPSTAGPGGPAGSAAAAATTGQFLGFRQLLNSASRLFGQQTDTPPTIDTEQDHPETQQEQQHQPDTPKAIDTEPSQPNPHEDEPAPANPPSPARSRSASPSTSTNPFHLHLHASHERTLITAAQTEIALMKRFDYMQPTYVDLLNDLTALTAQLVHKIEKGSKEKSIEKARKKVEKCLKKVRKWQKKELHGLCVKEAFGFGNPGEGTRAEEDKMDVDGEVAEKEEKEVAPDSAARAHRDTPERGEGEVGNAAQTTDADEAFPLTPKHKPSTEPQLPAAIAAPAEAEESTTPTQQPPHDVSTGPSLPPRLESEGYISSSPVPPAEQGQVSYPQIPMSDADIESEPPFEPSAEQEYAGDAAELISGEQLPRSSSPAIKLVSSPQKRHIGTPPARQAPILSPAVESTGRDQSDRDIEGDESSASESEHGDDAEVETRPSKTESVQAGYFSRSLASLSQRIKPLFGSPTKKAQKEVAVPEDAEEEEADDVATQSGDESQRSTPEPVTASQQPTQDVITKTQSTASYPHPESESSSESESEDEGEESLAAPSQSKSPSTANPSSQSKKPLNLDNLADSSSSDSDFEEGSKKKKRSSPRPSLGHLVKNNKPSQPLQRRSISHSQPAQSLSKTKSTAPDNSSDNDSDSDSDKDDDDDDDDGTDLLSQSQSRMQSPVRTRPTTTTNSPAVVGRRGMPFSASQPAPTAAARSSGRRQQRNTLKSLLSSQRSAGGF